MQIPLLDQSRGICPVRHIMGCLSPFLIPVGRQAWCRLRWPSVSMPTRTLFLVSATSKDRQLSLCRVASPCAAVFMRLRRRSLCAGILPAGLINGCQMLPYGWAVRQLFSSLQRCMPFFKKSRPASYFNIIFFVAFPPL